MALVPIDSRTCPKCGADLSPLRRVVEFAQLQWLYRKVLPPTEPNPMSSTREWDLYLAKTDVRNPPFFIIDRDGYVSPVRHAQSVEALDKNELRELYAGLPKKERERIESAAMLYGLKKDEVNYDNISKLFIIYKAVPRLRDTSFLKKLDWPKFVDGLVSFRVEKDPAIKAVHKSHLLRGLNMRINPHAITATNSGTGKSTFYEMVGLNIGKATPNSFLGYARSPDEIHIGIIHESELPINIDQIESQYAYQIVRFLFNALEQGKDTVSSGGTRFDVWTSSIFNFSANPIGYTKDPAKSFSNLLSHFTFNPAIGRRIAIFVYGNGFKLIPTKPTPDILDEWAHEIGTFRAVEEYCWPRLKDILLNPKTWGWLNQPMPYYEDSVKNIVADLEEGSAKDLILEHAAGAHVRLRAAPLYATLAENLDNIALGDYNIDELLISADEKLPTYVEINIQSFARIAKAWAKEQEAHAKALFEAMPEYLAEIVSAAELWKRAHPELHTVRILDIPYQPKGYRYLSQCVEKLSKRKSPGRELDQIRDYYKFDFTKLEKSDWSVTFLSEKPNPNINPLGNLIFPIFPISSFPNDVREGKSNEVSPENGNRVRDGPLQGRGNGENGKNGEGAESMGNEGQVPRKHKVNVNPDPFESMCCFCRDTCVITHYVDGLQACQTCAAKAERGEF